MTNVWTAEGGGLSSDYAIVSLFLSPSPRAVRPRSAALGTGPMQALLPATPPPTPADVG